MNNSAFPIPISKAQSIIADWGIDKPSEIHLELMAADLGILVVEKEISGSAARLICIGGRAIISVNQSIRESGKKSLQ